MSPCKDWIASLIFLSNFLYFHVAYVAYMCYNSGGGDAYAFTC